MLPNAHLTSHSRLSGSRWVITLSWLSGSWMNSQGWSPLGWTGWVSLQSKGLSRVFSTTTDWKHQFFGVQPFLWSNSYIHTWLLGKPQLCLDGPLLAKWHFCFLMCYVYHNFPSKEQVSFNFMASVTVWTDFHKIYHYFHFYLPWSDGTRCHDLNQRIKLIQLLFYFLFSFLKKKIFFNLATLGLSWATWDLPSSLWHVGSDSLTKDQTWSPSLRAWSFLSLVSSLDLLYLVFTC